MVLTGKLGDFGTNQRATRASTSWFLWGLQDHLLGWNRMKRIWNRIVITVITHLCIRNDLWHWVYYITGASLFLQGIFSHQTWLNSMTPRPRQMTNDSNRDMNASDVWRTKTHGQNLAKQYCHVINNLVGFTKRNWLCWFQLKSTHPLFSKFGVDPPERNILFMIS